MATALVAVALLVLLAVSTTSVLAAFRSAADSSGNVIAAASDFRAPDVTASAVGKEEGGATGYVRPGGAYHVYASVAADTGAPASGIASVVADASSVTAGATAVTMTAGSHQAGGATYDYRSPPLTADAGLVEGPHDFSVTATDGAGNADVAVADVVVDATPPAAAGVDSANGAGGTAGLAEAGDSLTLSPTERLDPETVVDGWTGGPTTVVVRLYDDPTGDYARVYDANDATALPLGTVGLGGEGYVTGGAGGHVTFGATGAGSTLTLDGDALVVTLGAYGAPGTAARGTQGTGGTASWTPGPGPTDRAGNPLSTAAAQEPGPLDVEL